MSQNNQADQLILNALKRKSPFRGRPPKVYAPSAQSPSTSGPSHPIEPSSINRTASEIQSVSVSVPLNHSQQFPKSSPGHKIPLSTADSIASGDTPASSNGIGIVTPDSVPWTELVMASPSASLSSAVQASAPNLSAAVPKWSPSQPPNPISVEDEIITARQEAAGRFRIVNISSESYSVPRPEAPLLALKAPRTDASLGVNIRALETFCRLPNPDLVDDDRYEQFEVAFHHIPKAFDSLRQDYLIETQHISKCVQVEWLDPPGLLPADIRGRHGLFFVSDSAVAAYPNRTIQPTLNSVHHHVEPKAKDETQTTAEAHPPTAASARYSSRARLNNIRKGVCCLIRPKAAYHGQPNPLTLLRISPHLRNLLHDAATLVGTTESRLRLRWYNSFCKIHPYVLWVKANYPERLPTTTDFQTAIRTALRQERLDRLPLAAISILHEANPSSFLHCEYPEGLALGGTQPFPADSSFIAIISPKHALQSAIRHATDRGLFLDSSWRNKNAIRCPVTLLATVNEYGHMVPVAVMVSNHANTDSYTEFLSVIRKAIKKEAKALLKGKSSVVSEYENEEQILINAEYIHEEDFLPLHFMIDCDDAERKAIEEVFPGTPIRLCQFHFMHAARSRALRLFGSDLVGTEKAFAFLVALRRCQRCSEEESWSEAFARLEADVAAISNNDPEIWDKIRTWLLSEWFSDRWRGYLVDYGLPPHHTRDGTLSTNNFVEAAFRTFDRVFLESRANKRIDKLLTIIIDVYFPMYLHSPPTSARCDPTVLSHILQGLELWEQGAVRECFGDEMPMSLRGQLDHTYCVTSSESSKTTPDLHYCGIKDKTRERCSCRYFTKTGKRCSGLWALYCFHTCGSSETYSNGVTANELRLQTRAIQLQRRLGEISYPLDQEDLVAYWGHDPSEPVWHDWSSEQPPKQGKLISIDSANLDFVEPDSPITRRNRFLNHADDHPSTTATLPVSRPEADKGGRPAAHRPLHPYRQKTAPTKAGIPRDALPPRDRPVGAKNYLQSCFALSLFHIVFRIPAFVSAFNEANDALRPHAPSLIVLLGDFLKAISVTRRLVDLKDIVPILRSENLIDEESQHDPCELFLRMTSKFNQIIEQNPIRNTFQFGVTWEYVFQPCSHAVPVRQETSSLEKQMTVLQIYPHGSSLNLIQLINLSLWRSCSPQHCFSVPCNGRMAVTRARAKMSLESNNLPRMLLLNIVWDLRNPSAHQVIHPFDIPETINPAQVSAVPPPILPSNLPMYRLKGMLCRKGDTVQVTSGHYVALIKHDDVLWEIDDEKTSRMFLNRDAFGGTRFPVLLFYTLEDEVKPSASQPIAKKRRLNKPSGKAMSKSASNPEIPKAEGPTLEAPNPQPPVSDAIPANSSNSELPTSAPPTLEPPNSGDPKVPPPNPTEQEPAPVDVQSTSLAPTSTPTDPTASQPNVLPTVSQGTIPPMSHPTRRAQTSKGVTPTDPTASQPNVLPTVSQGTIPPKPTHISPPGDEPPESGPSSSNMLCQTNTPQGESAPPDQAISLNPTVASQDITAEPDSPSSSMDIDPPSVVPTVERSPSPEVPQYCQLEKAQSVIAERLAQVQWRSGESFQPLISVSTFQDVDSLSDDLLEDLCDQMEAMFHDMAEDEHKGLKLQGVDSTFGSKTLRKFYGRNEWYTNFGIDDILLSVSAFIRNCVNLGIGMSDPIPNSFVYRTLAAGDNWNPYIPGGTPWPSLGKDGQWRKENTVGVLMSSSHFETLVIFGPQKLVLMYDGAGGTYDSGEQKKQWSRLLERRLSWEVRKGIATEAEAMGWLIAPNSQATRDNLDWVTQVDSHSCGPLACAAACLLLQGIRPTASVLGVKSSTLARGESRKLRTSVLQLVLAMAARDPANESIFSPKVKKLMDKSVPSMTYYIDRL
ncbi:hypothetical protein TREMEDRAFT_62382 [Tremella mesenterica DSM 1558]|uniref:uncharacterized protein n=1 Tax=Tremella mesenterica (strain ATCC 24925 / CBS 8224 / DSM 1558 / NBRC 9311 / NRRL Y-6157 / RJB 2259-6 / UBC 559-6) TaxID=578456 RepID=UPI0003F49171|nr:uncharacterized protein TREMEDRAFT_62382 [Tremella mesenterica DSM 1558]EIW69524.1 hypothetical protein TREMEDRAFT_62382 [Tremella mesenterica DSM 1558]